MHPRHAKNLRLLKEDLKRKNTTRDRFKKARVRSITSAQKILFEALKPLAKEFAFKVAKEREIYTKEGVRFADLFIKKYGLIVEVDGGYHLTPEQVRKDKKRDEEIWEKKMIITLRIKNEEVMGNIEDTLKTIRSVVTKLSTLPNHKSPGKGVKKLRNTLARKKIYNELCPQVASVR